MNAPFRHHAGDWASRFPRDARGAGHELEFFDNRLRRRIAGKDRDGRSVVWAPNFFAYIMPQFNLAAGATQTQSITIEADSHFEMLELARSGTANGASAPFSNESIVECTLQIKDAGAGREIFFQPVPIDSVCGTGQRPYRLPESYMFSPNSALTLTYVNYGSITYNNISVALIGRKLFKFNAQDQDQGGEPSTDELLRHFLLRELMARGRGR